MLLLLPREQVEAGGLRESLTAAWDAGSTGGSAAEPFAARGFGELLRARGLPLLAVRRIPAGLLGGLWELPTVETGAEGAFCARYGVELLGGPGPALRHAYSHFQERLAPVPGLIGRERRLEAWAEQLWAPAPGWGGLARTHQALQALRRLGWSAER
jgi:hypothetical protein